MIEYIIYRKKGLLYIVTIQNIIVYIDIQKKFSKRDNFISYMLKTRKKRFIVRVRKIY